MESSTRCVACGCGVPTKQDCLQGHLHERADALAVNDPGIGSGWQQSKQNWAHLVVVGECHRMRCRCLCCGEVLRLYVLLLFVVVVSVVGGSAEGGGIARKVLLN